MFLCQLITLNYTLFSKVFHLDFIWFWWFSPSNKNIIPKKRELVFFMLVLGIKHFRKEINPFCEHLEETSKSLIGRFTINAWRDFNAHCTVMVTIPPDCTGCDCLSPHPKVQLSWRHLRWKTFRTAAIHPRIEKKRSWEEEPILRSSQQSSSSSESSWTPCMFLVINDNPYGVMFALSYVCRICP
jgi:hypothetical protein